MYKVLQLPDVGGVAVPSELLESPLTNQPNEVGTTERMSELCSLGWYYAYSRDTKRPRRS